MEPLLSINPTENEPPNLPAENYGNFVLFMHKDNTIILDGEFTFKDIELLYTWWKDKQPEGVI